MKGLSLTLTIVIIAIVLLVTALVIMTIFGSQMAQVIGVLNPWSSSMLESSLCQQKCATWCQLNPDKSGPTGGWGAFEVETSDGKPENCDTVMARAAGDDVGNCKCLGFKPKDD